MAIPEKSVKWTGKFPLHQVSRREFFTLIERKTELFKKKFKPLEPTTVILHPDEVKAMGNQAFMIVNMKQLELVQDAEAPKNGFIITFRKGDQKLTT